MWNTTDREKIMTSIFRRAAAAVAALTLPVFLVVGCTADGEPGIRTTARTPVVAEDDPDFNCHTDGNRVCGTGAPADGYVSRYRPPTAERVCDGLAGQVFEICTDLAVRPARTVSPGVTDPDGVTLVAECRAQERVLTDDELYDCFDQPLD